ncbi:ribonuclease domain-containing protein [Nocardia sp. bgisy118]
MNREGTLPRTDATGGSITYQEWDVNPKQRNRSRDAQRIVTGSDGTAWYTGDHYETFTRMR